MYVLVGRKHATDRVQDRDYRRSSRTGRPESSTCRITSTYLQLA